MNKPKQPETIKDWEQEFDEQFCFMNFDGKKHYKSLRTNIDQTDDIKAFISSLYSQIRQEVLEEVRGVIKNQYPVEEEYKDLFREENIAMKKLFISLASMKKESCAEEELNGIKDNHCTCCTCFCVKCKDCLRQPCKYGHEPSRK